MTRNRIRGALIGLAVGDAVGTTVEFKPRGSFQPLTDMIGGGPFDLAPGHWTDDTSMALCLAESLVEKNGFDARDQMQRYVRWYRDGYLSSTGRCFDIGNTTRAALDRFIETDEPYAGSTDPHSAGNGSLMRLAPIAMFHANDIEQAVHFAGESSKTTHAAPVAVEACRYFARLLVQAMNGASKDELLASHDLDKPKTEIRSDGYVAHTLEAALWVFGNTSSFEEGCLRAANLGHDADTTAAVYGQIAGAYYGEDAIRRDWREKLALYHIIDVLAERLAGTE